MLGRLADRISERGAKRLAVLFVLLLFLLPLFVLLWLTAVPGHSYDGPLPPLSTDQALLAKQLRGDVTAIASVPHNTRFPIALEKSARYIERNLAGAGYTVRRQVYSADDQNVRNIDVVIEPADSGAETLVIGAHYDSFMDAPGANDNGTGVAGVLELAKRLADLRHRSKLRIRLVLFANEEPPYFRTDLMGSLVYADRLKRSGERVKGMVSLETIGFYSEQGGSQHYPAPLNLLYPDKGNFIAFVGLTSSRSFVRETVRGFREVARFPSVGGTAPGFIQGIGWSDHWSFEQVGIPALMITDTAPFRYPYYHSTEDTPDKVDYDRLARVISGLEQLVRRWAA